MIRTVGDLIEALMQLPLTEDVLVAATDDQGYQTYATIDQVEFTHTFKGDTCVLVWPL